MMKIKLTFVALLFFAVSACSPQNENRIARDPVNFETSDECHVCGMLIGQFSGPKGQAFNIGTTATTNSSQVKKFCSTMELMIWYLQPENRPNVAEIYVHDMSQAPWNKPDDSHMISARDAFFVVGSNMEGSMGATLASFSTEKDAANFIAEHDGKTVQFTDLTIELLTQ